MQSSFPLFGRHFIGVTTLQTSNLMTTISTEIFQLALNWPPQKVTETSYCTAWIKLFASSKYYFIPGYADTSGVPQSHSSPFSTKPFPQDGGAMMLLTSGMFVKHFGISLNMYFSKLWRLQELNFSGMIELYWESKRIYVRLGIGKEKQYPLQEKWNKWPSPKLLGATIFPNIYINKYNGHLLLIAGKKSGNKQIRKNLMY